LFESLTRRRATLIARSTAQRNEVATAAAGVQRASAEPLLLGAGVAVTLLLSPKLRGWLVRALATYAFVRQLISR
jgi:hypothetical protein